MAEIKKRVPKRRFKEFQDAGEWEERKFSELADIVRGASPRPIKDPKWFDENSEVGWLRIADVTEQDGRITSLEQRISKAGQEKTRVLYEPHLLLSIAATVGKPVVNYVKTGVHDGFLIFLNPKFDQEFMFQWFEMFRPKWQQFGQPGSQVNLNSDLVRNTTIILPKESEQKKISNHFKNLDTQISLQQRKLEKIKAMKKAYLTEMFPAAGETKPKRRFKGFSEDWVEKKFGEVNDLITGYPFESDQFTNDGIKLIRGMNVKRGNLDFAENICMRWPSSSGLERYLLSDNDILIQMDGALIGKSYAKIKKNQLPALLVQRVTRARTKKDKADSDFMYQTIQRDFLTYIRMNITETAVPHLSLSDIKNFEVMIPEMAEQRAIGKYFSDLDKQITLQQKKLSKLQKLKKAYLNELFI